MSQENVLEKESNLVSHARRELQILEAQAADEDGTECEMQKQVTTDVLEILRVLAYQNHSGSSNSYVLRLITRLAQFGNLTDLLGTDDEWMEVGEGMFQNTRCGHVFKNADGRAYDIDGYVGVDPNGSCWTGGGTPLCYVEFPYHPKSRYMPRLSLLPPIEDDEIPREERIEEFLYSTREAVLEFYERNGIEQPPEEEHVVKLRGKIEFVGGEGAPIQDAQIAEEPKL